MQRLFIKIFAIFWIAQSLIIVISTALIVRHRLPRPDALFESLSASLSVEGREQTNLFEEQGCSAFNANHDSNVIGLMDGSGKRLCGSPVALPHGHKLTRLEGEQLGNAYLWSAPVVSSTGRHYILQFQVPHRPDVAGLRHELIHFSFPQLPVAIAISGITTFLLTLLFTRPIVGLRRAARELAQGNLSTRVPQSFSGLNRGGEDEFHALIQDFNHMADRLESLVAAHKLLLRDVSHELRSPLARLGVALELAHEDALSGNTQHLERIEREAERLNSLINQLLTLSSMEIVQADVARHPLSLNDLVEDVVADAEYEARQRGCTVASHLETTFTVTGDQELLHRAIENVIRNAIRYTDPGTAISVTLSPLSMDSSQFAVVEVCDKGPGIPEADLQRVLKPFFRVDDARSRGTGGFGIGLAITDRVVALHRGKLMIENAPSGGAVVRICLPYEHQA